MVIFTPYGFVIVFRIQKYVSHFFFVLQYIPLYIFALSNVNSEYKKKKKGYLQLELHRKEHNLHFY